VNNHFEKHIPVTIAGKTALDYLDAETNLGRQQIKKTMQNGAVWLQSSHGISRIRRAKKILHAGDTLHIYYDKNIQQTIPDAATLIADEKDYSIWNKPCGMFSQGTKWGDHNTVYRWAEQHLTPQRPAFPVHRLDRAANGLIIIAHTKTTAAAFSAMFKTHRIKKQYNALVDGQVETLSLPYTINTPLDNKSAVTEILNVDIDSNNRQTLLTLSIQTGRKHQIRRHLSAMHHPIVGDRLYGSSVTDKDLQLRAIYLGFDCPLTKEFKEYRLT